jgi:hypothetical protein
VVLAFVVAAVRRRDLAEEAQDDVGADQDAVSAEQPERAADRRPPPVSSATSDRSL